MNHHDRGLYGKFNVSRTDGGSLPGGKHEHCRYFVLDLTCDPHAITAVKAYAVACRGTYPALAADLLKIAANAPQSPDARSDPVSSPILRYFAYSHLPESLQAISRPIGELAKSMDESLPDGPEKSAGLRKLLEAKDCFVRANLP